MVINNEQAKNSMTEFHPTLFHEFVDEKQPLMYHLTQKNSVKRHYNRRKIQRTNINSM